jgi:lambda repressor-like predicted transcriptional regulator
MTPLSMDDLRDVLRAKVEALGSVRAASRKLGVSETAIRACLNSGDDPGEKLARALGFRPAPTVFVPLRKGDVA